MAGHRECDSVVTSGRLAKANEFFGAAEHLEDDMPSAAGGLYGKQTVDPSGTSPPCWV